MIRSMTYRLAIFDFDGTLADTFPFFLSVFNVIADKHGFRRIDPNRVDDMRRHGVREIMAQIGMPAWKLPLAARSFTGMMREQAASIPLFDGIPDTLRHLAARGVRLAVVSSNAEHNVRTVLGPELEGLVARYECGMSVFGKARRIRGVLAAEGVAPDAAIYVGDQTTDLEAARDAGVPFGAVRWGYAAIEALREAGADVEFAHPEELQRIGG
jgi:phosphoglycolate phosphatase